MIKITITSEIMKVTQEFKTDVKALRYLKQVKKIHLLAGIQKAGPRPIKKVYRERFSKWLYYSRFKADLAAWKLNVNFYPVKVQIERDAAV